MNPTRQKLIILCMGAAFLLLACQGVGYRPELSIQETAPGGLRLPATFNGTLPCADCVGIRYHLDLWSDGVFHLRQSYLGTSVVADNRGRWHKDPRRVHR